MLCCNFRYYLHPYSNNNLRHLIPFLIHSLWAELFHFDFLYPYYHLYRIEVAFVGDNVEIVTADEMTAKSSAEDIARFTGELTREFIAGKVDCVEVVYTHYKSASKQILATRQLLPIAADDLATGEKVERNKPYLFEPDVNTIYNEVLPLYVLSSMQ